MWTDFACLFVLYSTLLYCVYQSPLMAVYALLLLLQVLSIAFLLASVANQYGSLLLLLLLAV